MRIVRSALLSLALWSAGGFFAFLLLPVLCEMPLWLGVAAGWLAFGLQLLWGQDLVRCLLRWQDGAGQSEQLGASPRLIDADCPLVLLLPDLTLTRGAAKAGLTREMVSEWRTLAPSPAEAAYLVRLLALPCLLRAFEAVTSSYGKLRFSEGPLWYLGRFFAGLAKIAEAPLRWCWGEKKPSCALQAMLAISMAEQAKLPAWIRALDLLAPVSVAEVARERRWRLLLGEAVSGEKDRETLTLGEAVSGRAVPSVTVSYIWLPVTGLLLGVLLAVSPWHWWGALPLCLGLSWGFYFKLRWPEWQSATLDTPISEQGQRVLAVHWQGRLENSPSDMAFPRQGWCLRTKRGLVALRRVPGKKRRQNWVDSGQELDIWGWFDLRRMELQVEAVQADSQRYRDRFLLKYAPWPWLLAISGGAWLALQYIGL